MHMPDYFQYFLMNNIFVCSNDIELLAKNNPWRLSHCA